MKTHMTQEPDKVETSPGVVWKPKFVRRQKRESPKAKPATLAEMNARLAASRDYRISASEKNAMKIIGRTRL